MTDLATDQDFPPETQAELRRLRALSFLLDSAIPVPGTRWRVGLDPLLGLLPGFGDAAGAVLSAYIMLGAARLGVSRATLLRMAANVGVEAVVGAIPLVGDLFDAGWKANSRNLRLVEEHLSRPGRVERASRAWLIGVIAGIVLLLLGGAALAVWLGVALLRALGLA